MEFWVAQFWQSIDHSDPCSNTLCSAVTMVQRVRSQCSILTSWAHACLAIYWAQNQRCALPAFTFPSPVKTSFVCSSKMATGAPKKPPPRWADVEDSSSDLDDYIDTMSRSTSVAKNDADQHVARQQAPIGGKPSEDGLIEVATTGPGACSSTYCAEQADIYSCTPAVVGGRHGSTPLDETHGDAYCCNGWYLC